MVIKNKRFNIYYIKFDAEEELILTKLSSCFFPRLFFGCRLLNTVLPFFFFLSQTSSLNKKQTKKLEAT